MNYTKQKKAAKEFAAKWQGKGYEKGESQKFWFELLQNVFNVENPTDLMECEVPVMLEHTSFIDVYLPQTKVMIEQKSIGKDLSKPIKQSDGTLLTPMQQLKRYAAALGYFKYPRWGITCNFAEFYIYDMGNPNCEPEIIKLADLEKDYHRLSFLVDNTQDNIKKELEISLNAGTLVGKMYELLLKQYGENPTTEMLESLNMLIVRLVFCMYAEDAGIFGRKNMFIDYLNDFRPQHFRKALIDLFKILDIPINQRDPYEEKQLLEFPYVNGGLFKDDNIIIPQFDQECVDLIINEACTFDWAEISPTIFGAVFESTLAAKTRRTGGMHYTSIENIHKVIDPLFLNDLKTEYEEILETAQPKKLQEKLQAFQDKLASLSFFDPACGSGNFLTETYISLRRLENQVIAKINKNQITLGDFATPVKVSIQQFYGIEINDYACVVAKTALWIAELQMMQETQTLVHMNLDFLPLKTYANIVEGNALRLDWNEVVPKEKLNYIMGNPPFSGFKMQSTEQRNDMQYLGKAINKIGILDYVCGWYIKAAQYVQNTKICCAFVSTNSITQGEQPEVLWNEMFSLGMEINYAYRTFVWNSESNSVANVHCVIIAFSSQGTHKKDKILYDGEHSKAVSNITPHLAEGDNILIKSLSKPLCDVPQMIAGNKTVKCLALILSPEEKDDLIRKNPNAQKYIKRMIGAKEFINNIPRYCLWLVGASPKEIQSMPEVFKRVQQVRADRLASKDKQAHVLADKPSLFRDTNNPDTAIVVPLVSSQLRRYIPIGYINSDTIANNKVSIIPNGTMYQFGILCSNVHNSWMRRVAMRMKSDYSYSLSIVYNTFPWPSVSEKQRLKIEATAQGILDARALFPDCSLAELYNEVTMPPELRKAHQANDRAVMEAYGFWGRLNSESECVAELMKMYQNLTAK